MFKNYVQGLNVYNKTLLFLYAFSLCFTFLQPLLAAYLLGQLNLSSIQVGIVMSLNALSIAFSMPLIGKALDQKKFKLCAIVSSVFFLLGCTLFLLKVNQISLILLASILLILGLRGVSLLIEYGLMESCQKEYRSKMAFLRFLSGNLGMSCASLIAFFFLTQYESLLIGADMMSTLIACLGAWFVINTMLVSKKSGHTVKEKPKVLSYKNILEDIKRNPSFCIMMTMFWTLLFNASFALPMLYAFNQVEVVKSTAVLFIASSLAVLVIGPKLSQIHEKISAQKQFLLGSVFFAIHFILSPYLLTWFTIPIIAVLYTLSEIVWVPLMTKTVQDYYGEDNLGMATAMEGFYKYCGAAICPILAGVFFYVIRHMNVASGNIVFIVFYVLLSFVPFWMYKTSFYKN